jgi:hypothetical protein
LKIRVLRQSVTCQQHRCGHLKSHSSVFITAARYLTSFLRNHGRARAQVAEGDGLEGRCEILEEEVTDRQKRVILQLGGERRGAGSSLAQKSTWLEMLHKASGMGRSYGMNTLKEERRLRVFENTWT